MIGKWYEIWIDDTLSVPYVLMVTTKDHDGKELYLVIDLFEGGEVVYQHSEYQEVVYWLLEDEYSMVRGRVMVDE